MYQKKLPPNARALVWCAVSTTRQARDDHASMEEQETWATNVCQENGWQIVEILRVPGHSRNYKDLHTLATDARAKGIDAFDRLIKHLEKCDFDVFICRDANRFARRASLLHYLVESIIDDCGAVIYSQHDGWVDKSNAAGFAAMKGYSTTQDISWMRESKKIGSKKRLERGLTASGRMPSSHRLIRDPRTGKGVEFVINDDMTHLYHCMGTLVLEGSSWSSMGLGLYNRFGIKNENNELYSQSGVYSRLYNPLIWGNVAMSRAGKRVGEWVFYEHPSKPEGVIIEYGVVPPMYHGRFERELRDELIRRLEIRGNARPNETYRFANTCICGVCGCPMVVASQSIKEGKRQNHHTITRYTETSYGTMQYALVCHHKSKKLITGERRCTSSLVYQSTLEQAFTDILNWLADGEPLANYFQHPEERLGLDVDADAINADIDKVDKQIKNLIKQQSLAPESVQDMYHAEIRVLSEQLIILQQRYENAMHQKRSLRSVDLDRLNELTIEKLWDIPDFQINKLLKSILGRYRLVVVNGEVISMKLV